MCESEGCVCEGVEVWRIFMCEYEGVCVCVSVWGMEGF